MRITQRIREGMLRSAQGLPLEEPAAPVSPDEPWQSIQPVLDAEIQRLPEKYRAPLVLCCLEGLSRDEAAKRLGWQLGALKGRLERGRERLRLGLERRGVIVSSILLSTAIAHEAAQAVPPATQTAAFAAVVHGTISPSVSALVQGVYQAMSWTRFKVGMTVALLLTLGTSAGALTYQALAEADKGPENPTHVPNQLAVTPVELVKPAAEEKKDVAEVKLKTDAEVLRFLVQCVREDKSVAGRDWSRLEEHFQSGQRQDVPGFAKVFKKHELWLVSDSSPVGGGRNPRWLLAVNRSKPQAFLIGDVLGDTFKNNMAALFAAEAISPKDNAEALALGKLAVALTCHAYSSVVFRDELTPDHVKALDADLAAKLTAPVAERKDGGLKVKVPGYRIAQELFSKRLSIVVYELDFDGKGGLRFDSTEAGFKIIKDRR
jgi:hypothetical protein